MVKIGASSRIPDDLPGDEDLWPIGWDKFVELIRGANRLFPEGLPTWAARFRAARAFSGVQFDGLSQESTDAYFVGLKLTLVESALETYEAATGRQTG